MKNEKKNQMMQQAGRRDAARSTNPPIENTKEEKPEAHPYEIDMLKFLGLTLTPEMRAAHQAVSDAREHQQPL